MKRFLTFAALFLAAMVLASCGSAVKLTKLPDGGVVDESTGKTYTYCSISIAPIRLGEKYGKGPRGFELFRIQDAADGWLSDGTDIPFVYREQSIPEPDLHSFHAVRAVVTQTVTATVRVGSIETPEKVARLIDLFDTSPEVEYPSVVEQVYTISLISDDYPGLFYNLMYIETAEGKTYLRDRGTGKCVDGKSILMTLGQEETTPATAA